MKQAIPQTLERSQEMAAEPTLGAAIPVRPREAAAPRREARKDAPRGAIFAISLGFHAVAFAVLGALPEAPNAIAPALESFEMVVLDPPAALETPPVEAALPEPAPAAVLPAPIAHAPRTPAPTLAPDPAPAAAEPTPPPPVPSLAPPSVDDVFAEPAPLPSLSAAAGTGGFTVPAGSSSGVAGGRGAASNGAGSIGSSSNDGGPSAEQLRQARRSYARSVRDVLESSARYPVAARVQRIEGRVELALRIDALGHLIAARVATSSGYAVLDDAALATARELSAYPAPPSLVPWDEREEVRTPIAYELIR
jgi:periplasmic protein TonB